LLMSHPPHASISTQGLFNNAAQAGNHDLYWKCMQPGGGGAATGPIGERIIQDFGSYDEFQTQFEAAGNTAFGSGWAWLSWDGGKLVVNKSIGAANPITDGKKGFDELLTKLVKNSYKNGGIFLFLSIKSFKSSRRPTKFAEWYRGPDCGFDTGGSAVESRKKF